MRIMCPRTYSKYLSIFYFYFVPELFGIRIFGFDDDDGSRFLSFNTLVEVAVMEIRVNNYKSAA